MGKVIYGQYVSGKYPLKKFYLTDLPRKIGDVLYKLGQMESVAFRGGLAFIFLTNANNYLLKDLDMLALDSEKESILDVITTADIVFVNKNTFGDTVLTAFWQENEEYFKLDILLCSELPGICEKVVVGKKMNVVSASYIWRNKIEKIAEKEIRGHDDRKTLNHYRVASKMSKYLLRNKEEILTADTEIANSKLSATEKILSGLISEKDLEIFLQLQMDLIRG